MHLRGLVGLAVAAAVIALLCVYKLTRTYEPTRPNVGPRHETAAAPLFELYDEHSPSRRVRLVSYIGRHPILIVFFDGQAGADQSPVLSRLVRNFAGIEATGTVVFAVSDALPQQNRKIIERTGPFPFPLLSDPDYAVHRQWGRVDEQSGRPLTGTFLIDRAGRVAWRSGRPLPVNDPQQLIDRILEVD